MKLLIALLIAVPALAEKSAFEQAMEQHTDYVTREQWVSRGDKRYRQVIYQNHRYYVKLSQPDFSEGALSCGMPEEINSQPLVETGIQVYKRTKAFVEFLQSTCRTINGRGQRMVTFEPLRLGFTIPDDKKSVIKNKKVLWDPLHPVGVDFKGEF